MQPIRLRVRLAAAHTAGLPGWQVVRNGMILCSFPWQSDAVRYARKVGYEVLDDGFEAELAVVDPTGYVEVERFCRAPGWGPRLDFELVAEHA